MGCLPRLAAVLVIALAIAGCSVTSTVYGIVGSEDDLYAGSATGYISRTGTIELMNIQGNRCSGDFAYYPGVLAGRGIIGCDDGQRATIEFIGLSPMSGYGTGISGNGHRVAFTYGLSREQSILYLGLGSARPPSRPRS